MGTLRKYLMNGAIISSLFSGISAFRQGRKAPTDWRTYLTWIAWALTLAVAIGTIRKESVDPDAPKVAAGPRPSKGRKKAKKDD
ncbi:hypothetical protein [Amnibacterium kyonggiense]|uniref:Uncharacterized protein n=1 Tax=Amnibacterium kyonggiense TaxID=595671 RepID=A0A4R7FJC1_9MICO|nr:hypothetical protein [Amnibacterium kyonggiense]TDS76174.1 hypothetical protein CLV52_3294 [Amnibacterium kyonggiense]